MDKPRIFLDSSGKQEKLLRGLTRGLEDVAHVEPWTTSFNPVTTTLERLFATRVRFHHDGMDSSRFRCAMMARIS